MKKLRFTVVAVSLFVAAIAFAASTQYIAGAQTFLDDVTFLKSLTNSGMFYTDTISEKTDDTGVTVDGVLLKDGVVTGAVTGNASTATALAANPTDCSSNQYANAIAASGNLSCSAIADADVPDALTISGGTVLGG